LKLNGYDEKAEERFMHPALPRLPSMIRSRKAWRVENGSFPSILKGRFPMRKRQGGSCRDRGASGHSGVPFGVGWVRL